MTEFLNKHIEISIVNILSTLFYHPLKKVDINANSYLTLGNIYLAVISRFLNFTKFEIFALSDIMYIISLQASILSDVRFGIMIIIRFGLGRCY